MSDQTLTLIACLVYASVVTALFLFNQKRAAWIVFWLVFLGNCAYRMNQ